MQPLLQETLLFAETPRAIAGGTGHRPPRLGGYRLEVETRLHTVIGVALEARRPDLAITGLAQGFDQALAEVAYEMGIPYIGAIPCPDQDAPWPPSARRRYQRLVSLAAEVVVVSPVYTRDCMAKRDRWIVDRATYLLALFDGDYESGTGITVRYAERKRLEVVNLWPQWLASSPMFAVAPLHETR